MFYNFFSALAGGSGMLRIVRSVLWVLAGVR